MDLIEREKWSSLFFDAIEIVEFLTRIRRILFAYYFTFSIFNFYLIE